MTVFYLVAGLLLLLFGGDFLVRGASGMARVWRVPPIVIGVILVGFGTSAPELMVSLKAALSGSPGIAIGNVVGSNIANILLILGLAAVIAPMPARFTKLKFELSWMLAAALVLPVVFLNLWVGRLEGLLMLAALALCVVWTIRRAPKIVEPELTPPSLPLSVITALAGLGGVLIGADFLVDSATTIARHFGVSEALIGLTIVAVGTSLPEMATSVIAAFRGQREIAIGNAVGSNIFNILGILGVTALISPIPVEPRFLTLDVWIMIAVSFVLTALIYLHDALSRRAGLVLVGLYVAYTVLSALI
jgi:cation:H+ antiporter